MDGSERRLNLLIVALTLAAVVAIPFLFINADPLVALPGGGSRSSIDCGHFALDRAARQKRGDFEARQEQANGLVKCDALAGMPRAEVRQMLDDEDALHPNRDRWVYYVGEVNDFLGPGDGQSMNVYFDRGDTVTGTRLSLPVD